MARGRKPVQQELNNMINGMTAYIVERKTFTGVKSLAIIIADTESSAVSYAKGAYNDPGAKAIDRIRDITVVV